MTSNLSESIPAQGANAGTWNNETASEWLSKGEWKNGLGLEVHSSVDKIIFAEQYHKNKALWDKMFAFVRDTNLEGMEPGTYTIEGDNLYAIISEGPSKEFEQSGWEAHKKYIDLQYVISGEEKIGVVPLTESVVTKPYDEEKDYGNFSAEGKYYTASPGTFFLFFPGDVHRPNILVKGHEVVKKLVIKIRVA